MHLALMEERLNWPPIKSEAMLSFGEFLRLLLEALVQQGVSPCILRNYEGFPESNAGNDIDFMIHPAELPLAIRAIQSIDKVRIVGFNEQFHVAMFFIQGVSQTPGARALQVDFIRSFTWKGMPYLSTEAVRKAAIRRDVDGCSFLVPSPIHETIISLLTSLVVSGFVKEKYFPKVQKTFAANRDEVIAALEPAFGKTQAIRLADSTIAGNRQQIIARVHPLRRALTVRHLAHKPLRGVFAIVRHHMIVFSVRYSSRTLTTVCIIGPNQKARTATVDALIRMLHYAAPHLIRCDSVSVLQADAEKSATGSSADRSFVSMARLSARLFEGWLSQCKGRRNLTLRICASSFFDFVADPLECGYFGPAWFARFVYALSPAPDLWVLLDPSPQNSLSETSTAQVSNAQTGLERYRVLVESKRSQTTVDGSQGLDALAEQTYVAIINFLSHQSAKQLSSFV